MVRFAMVAVFALAPATAFADDVQDMLKKNLELLEKEARQLRERSATYERLVEEMKRLAIEAKAARAAQQAEQGPRLDKLIEQWKKDGLLKGTKKAPKGLSGRVQACKDGYIQFNLGIDAGLQTGMVMDLYRDDKNDPRFLGTVVIERVYPKEAVGAFKPASGKPLEKLKAEELPKAADAVGTYDGKK